MVGPRRVRIASGLRDPPRHVVVTALDRTGNHAASDGLSDDDMPRPSQAVPLDQLRAVARNRWMHPCMPQPSFMRSHAHTRCTSMQTDNHNAIEHAHYSSLRACVWVFFFWFSSWCARVRFCFAFRKQVIMQDAKTYAADATEPMPARCARSRIEARCCHRDHGRSG